MTDEVPPRLVSACAPLLHRCTHGPRLYGVTTPLPTRDEVIAKSSDGPEPRNGGGSPGPRKKRTPRFAGRSRWTTLLCDGSVRVHVCSAYARLWSEEYSDRRQLVGTHNCSLKLRNHSCHPQSNSSSPFLILLLYSLTPLLTKWYQIHRFGCDTITAYPKRTLDFSSGVIAGAFSILFRWVLMKI